MKIIFTYKFKQTLIASSLINAIFICVVISIFCSCLVLVSHYQNVLNNQLYLQEDLINNNNSSLNYFISNVESIPYDKINELNLFDDEIPSYIQKKNWGFYDVLVCKTIFKNDTIHKTVLVGEKNTNGDNLALYTTNYDKPLKLAGKTKILGQIRIPNGHIEQAYINGQKGNNIKLLGPQLKSGKNLPKIDKRITTDILNFKPISLNRIDRQTIFFNGFDQTTKVIDLSGISKLGDITCKGNIILLSKNKLEIGKTAHLQDVLIMAPEVYISTGFKGSLQIFAKQKVDIEKGVSLLYPSSIYIKNDMDSVSVAIRENSKIIGGIVVDGTTYQGSLKRLLKIDENATVIGNVYCYGSIQLQGSVIGNVYADRFYLQTKSSNYENVILNGTINRDSLPKKFIGLSLFKNIFDKKKYAVIKEF